MRVSASRFVPVLIRFPDAEARHDAWGRFLEVRSHQARLITRTRLDRGSNMYLEFELPGETFTAVYANVQETSTDEDGYCVCLLLFPHDRDRVRLGRALARILTAVA